MDNNDLLMLLTSLVGANRAYQLDGTASISHQAIASVELGDVEILDKDGKPTGKTEPKPTIFLTNGDSRVLTDEQIKFFMPRWNAVIENTNLADAYLKSMRLQIISQINAPVAPPPSA